MSVASSISDPLQGSSGPKTAWTRVNMAEGLPGVFTPLSWSFWGDPLERMCREAHFDMGVLSDTHLPPMDAEDRGISIFYGRTALNVDVFRDWADAQPWSSGDALEEFYFGAVRPDVTSTPRWRRYPVVVAKMAPLAARLPRQIRRQFTETKHWWQASTDPARDTDAASARARFRDSYAQFAKVGRPHSASAMVANAFCQKLGVLCASAGHSDLMMTLLGGHQSVEVETTSDLWRMSRDELSLVEFLRRHGFQGPLQGEMSSAPWRDAPAPVERLAVTYRSMDDDQDPRVAERRRVAEREAGERELLGALRPVQRPGARVVFLGLHAHIPCREYGKASLMMALDGARVSARDLGAELTRAGHLDGPDDIFFLTMDEILGEPPMDARAIVAFRRARRAEYEALELPESWIGTPVPVAPTAAPSLEASGDGLPGGIGVSPGVVEAPVRVITDIYVDEDLEPGEILVCETTDPSWAPYFVVAAGVIMDVGGAMSHGSIVARESGIPCVVNVKRATQTLRTGDRVRIDGGSGEVQVLQSAPR